MSAQAIAAGLYTDVVALKRYISGDRIPLLCRRRLMRELYRMQKLTCCLYDALAPEDFSEKHFHLVESINDSIAEACCLLSEKSRERHRIACRIIPGLHNYPRAFLDAEHPMKISPEDAAKYAQAYLISAE